VVKKVKENLPDEHPENQEPVENILEQESLRELFQPQNNKKIQYVRVYRFPNKEESINSKSALPIFVCELNIDEYPTLPEIYQRIQEVKPKGGKFKLQPVASNHCQFTGQSRIVSLDGISPKEKIDVNSEVENPAQTGDMITKIYSLISNGQQSDVIAEKYNNLVNMYQNEMKNTLSGVKNLSELKTGILEENMKMREDFHNREIKMIQSISEQNFKVMEMMNEVRQTDDIPSWMKILIESLGPYIPAIAKNLKTGIGKINKIPNNNFNRKSQIEVEKENIQDTRGKETMNIDNIVKQNFIWIFKQLEKEISIDDIAEEIYAKAILGKRKKDLWDLVCKENIKAYLISILPNYEGDLETHEESIQGVILILGEYLEPEFGEEPEEILPSGNEVIESKENSQEGQNEKESTG